MIKKNIKIKNTNYKPFRMSGSWVGAILLIIIYFSFFSNLGYIMAKNTVNNVCPYKDGTSCSMWNSGSMMFWQGYNADINNATFKFNLIFILIYSVVGFIVGWQIQKMMINKNKGVR